jgi:hypothetical protein
MAKLSDQPCARCGKLIPVKNERYCSNTCRSAKETNRAAARACGRAEAYRTLSRNAATPDGFACLQGDAILSQWKPHVTLETNISDIPDFLRR